MNEHLKTARVTGCSIQLPFHLRPVPLYECPCSGALLDWDLDLGLTLVLCLLLLNFHLFYKTQGGVVEKRVEVKEEEKRQVEDGFKDNRQLFLM